MVKGAIIVANSIYSESTVTCACGNTFETKSTKSEIKVEVCSKCHPFFTGKQTDSSKKAGAVDKFNRRLQQANK